MAEYTEWEAPTCGCRATRHLHGHYEISYCPKHKSAPDLYEALKVIVIQANKSSIGIGTALATRIKEGEQALAKAEGK